MIVLNLFVKIMANKSFLNQNSENNHNFDKGIVINVDDSSFCRTALLEIFNGRTCHDVMLVSGADTMR